LIDKTDAFSRQVYEHETSMLKVLAHPNILTLVDSFETPEVYVIVTQYLAGGEMFDRLQELHHYTEQVFDVFCVRFFLFSDV
jgi:calcium-dependent protein kinase